MLYSDSQRCIATAEQAFEHAARRGDLQAQGWARLSRGFHLIWYATPQEAMDELNEAQRCFADVRSRPGQLLAEVGLARCGWRDGQFRASLERVLPLRDEGLRILKHDELGMLLATIAGCYSELGESQQAFAYMYQALREAGAGKSQGFDVVLYCNLAHELIQLGDYHQALSYLHEGLERCARLNNARLFSVLSINRVICLTKLGRPAEALPDVRRLLRLPADKDGRGADERALRDAGAGGTAGRRRGAGRRSGRPRLPHAGRQHGARRARHAARGPGRAVDGPRRAGPKLPCSCSRRPKPAPACVCAACTSMRWRQRTNGWATPPQRCRRCACGRSCTPSARCWPRARATRRRRCRPNCCA